VRLEKLAEARATIEARANGLEPEADVHPLLRPLRRGDVRSAQNEGERGRYRASSAKFAPIVRQSVTLRREN
jgi:hypothetical protein